MYGAVVFAVVVGAVTTLLVIRHRKKIAEKMVLANYRVSPELCAGDDAAEGFPEGKGSGVLSGSLSMAECGSPTGKVSCREWPLLPTRLSADSFERRADALFVGGADPLRETPPALLTHSALCAPVAEWGAVVRCGWRLPRKGWAGEQRGRERGQRRLWDCAPKAVPGLGQERPRKHRGERAHVLSVGGGGVAFKRSRRERQLGQLGRARQPTEQRARRAVHAGRLGVWR